MTDRSDELRTWGTRTLAALDQAMDKLVRQRQATDGIVAADPRQQDWFDLSHIDPATPGAFPGVGSSGTVTRADPVEAPASTPQAETIDGQPTTVQAEPRRATHDAAGRDHRRATHGGAGRAWRGPAHPTAGGAREVTR